MKRTNTCGEITRKFIGKKAVLSGWVHSRRDHGGIIFIDLRDRYGITQLVFEPENKKLFQEADKLRREYVISVEGKIRERPKGMKNLNLKTGEVEVVVSNLELVNRSDVPPLEVEDRIEANEDTRLKYRFLDLRRPKMQHNLITRHKLTKAIRDFMDKQGFLEIETPFLTKSTPEGARDYVVPSRIHPGKFYALPQSPQLFKQILMVAGFDKYFQIVRCFRDEDLRADRQPEFTQVDIEMSFIDENDIQTIISGLLKYTFKELLNTDLKIPIKKITYEEAIEKYGTDKPDLRFGLELQNVTGIAKKSEFNIFKNAELVKCLKVKADFSRTELEELTKLAINYGAKGLAWIKVSDKLESPIVKFLSDKLQKELTNETKAKRGDILFFIADNAKITNSVLAGLRCELGKKLNLIKEKWSFVWVVDFPLFEFSEEENRLVSMHHPFTSPKEEDLKLLDREPEKVKAKAYDIVLNGVEIGGGSIRIHKHEIQEKIFKILGINEKEAKARFGFLLETLKYGAPNHGGIALGLDRIAAIITGNESIREVIAFPKNKAAECLLSGAPDAIDEAKLKELHLKIDLAKK